MLIALVAPSLWQVAAGLGVGAFVAALFYGVVKHFGRNKGEGFETSKLGTQATAIIAVLIVLIAGGATIVALVLYAPRDPKPTTLPALPPDALNAKAGWERGTTIILTNWRSQTARYSEILAQKLGTTVDKLGKMDAATVEKARLLHAVVFAQLEGEAHQEYLDKDADPRTVNPALRHYFSGVVVRYPDGTHQTIEEATKAGRAMHEHYFELVRDAVIAGKDPLEDGAVNKHMDDYLTRRQAVTEALDIRVVTGR